MPDIQKIVIMPLAHFPELRTKRTPKESKWAVGVKTAEGNIRINLTHLRHLDGAVKRRMCRGKVVEVGNG